MTTATVEKLKAQQVHTLAVGNILNLDTKDLDALWADDSQIHLRAHRTEMTQEVQGGQRVHADYSLCISKLFSSCQRKLRSILGDDLDASALSQFRSQFMTTAINEASRVLEQTNLEWYDFRISISPGGDIECRSTLKTTRKSP